MPGLGGGGLNNMSALAGVNALSSAIHQAAHPAASAATLAVPNPGAGVNTVFSGLPAMPADTLQQAYSGIQQYVGKAAFVVFITTEEQPYQMYISMLSSFVFLSQKMHFCCHVYFCRHIYVKKH